MHQRDSPPDDPSLCAETRQACARYMIRDMICWTRNATTRMFYHPPRKLTIFSPMTIGVCMRILRRMSVLASYAKDPAVRPPGPDVPSVQAPAVRALNSDAGGYNHLGVAKKGKVRRCVVSFLSRTLLTDNRRRARVE